MLFPSIDVKTLNKQSLYRFRNLAGFFILPAICNALLIVSVILCVTLPHVWVRVIACLVAAVNLAVFILFALRLLHIAQRSNLSETEDRIAPCFEAARSSYLFPAAVVDGAAKMIWCNDAMAELCGYAGAERAVGAPLSDISPDVLRNPSDSEEVTVSGRTFRLSSLGYEAPDDGGDDSRARAEDGTPLAAGRARHDNRWIVFLSETTELRETQAQMNREFPVVAYAAIDGAEQTSNEEFRAATAAAEKKLRDWVTSLEGIIREYERDKYIIVFPKSVLPACADGKFEILEDVRTVMIGSTRRPVTVSMGVASCGKTFAQRNEIASKALEDAIQRGGDQVALRTDEGTKYYGGRTKLQSKTNPLMLQTAAAELPRLMREARNVLVMGHSNPDFDSIGSCIGLARLAMHYNAPENVKIVVNRQSPNFRVCTADLLREEPQFDTTFISGDAALDVITSETLLIVSDVNTMRIVESPDVVRSVLAKIETEPAAKYAVIDHHIKDKDFLANFLYDPLVSCIMPAASSASELVVRLFELIEQRSADDDTPELTRSEANVLLSGIMLDTQNFTRSCSEGTFAAAMYLRRAGADPELARTFFYTHYEDFSFESRIGSNLEIYRDRVAFASVEGSGAPAERISAARTADTLLTLIGIDASFVLISNGTNVAISARSNGSINVASILEKAKELKNSPDPDTPKNWNGGGHFDSAGGGASGETVEDVMAVLRSCVDFYLDAENKPEA